MEQVHATCVEIDGAAVLLRGPPGSGKSDLALRLIEEGARLVADDRADIGHDDGSLLVSAPAEIAGLLEVHGLGVFRLECVAASPLALVVDLIAEDAVERLPEERTCDILGNEVPCVALAPFHASAPAKVRLAVGAATGAIMRVP